MDLSIILVNYKSPKLVLNCVESIYQQTHSLSFEIIVVDNFSEDSSEAEIKSKYADIKWLQMGYNAGFARANNAGIKISQGKYILILNTDTIILDGALDKVVKLFSAQKNIAACGVQLLNTDGSNQISGAHFVKGGLNLLLPLPYLGKFIRYWGYRLKSTPPSITSIQIMQEVDWIVGAFIFTTKELAFSTLLDEDFFMYAEEIEWCSRLQKKGKLVLFEEPKVIHIGGATSGEYYNTNENENSKNLWNKKGRQILISQMLRIRKQNGVGWFLFISCILFFEIILFFVCILFDKILFQKNAKFTWLSFKNYCLNIFVLFKNSFKILKNKPHFYKVL